MFRPLLAAALLAFGLRATVAASATPERHAGAIAIRRPWIRPVPPGVPAGAAYVTLVNAGGTADRILGGSTPVAEHLEIHQMALSHGIMTMRAAAGGLAIPPHATVVLEPGGFHIMLTGLQGPLRAGERVPVTLVFQRAGRIVVPFTVEALRESSR